MDLSIVIPTYNEKENILKLIKEIFKVFKKNKIHGKIIIVDDNSPDGTGDIADNLAKNYPILVLHRKRNRGYGNSIIAGLKEAIKINSDVIITMDADFSHNPLIIPQMLNEIKKGYDVVIGSRRVNKGKIIGWSSWRHFCSKSATWLSRLMLNLKTKDITSGFRAYKLSVLKKIPFSNIKSNGYSFLEEFLYFIESNNFKIKEIPITFIDRRYGKSKLSKKEIIKFFITILRLRFGKTYEIVKNTRLIRFLIVGAIGVIVNMFFLWLFKSKIKMPLEFAGIFAIELSVINNFILNNFWTFRESTNESHLSIRFLKYHISVVIGVGVNYAVLLALTKTGLFYLLSNLIGIVCATISNYLFSSKWAWRDK